MNEPLSFGVTDNPRQYAIDLECKLRVTEAENERLRADQSRVAVAVNVQLADLRDKWNASEARLEELRQSHLKVEEANRNLKARLAGLEDTRRQLVVEKDEMAERLREVVEALRQWKCPKCGGEGEYDDKHVGPPVPCESCVETGLAPIARAALAAAQPEEPHD